MTDAFKVFEANLDRSRAFLRIFDKDRSAGQPTNDRRSCCVARSSLRWVRSTPISAT